MLSRETHAGAGAEADGRRLKTDDRQKKKTGLVGPVSRSNWFEAAIWLG